MERLFSLTRALVARKRKIFALFFALAASIGMSFAQDPGIVSSGTKGGMSYTFYDNGLLEISGSGALPGSAFTNWDGGFGTSVKNIRFAEDCEVYGLDYMWFACYTENSQLETIEINSVAPIMFSGTSGGGITYRQDGAVTITITAPGIVDVEGEIIDNYGSPVNMIFNMPATTVFEKKWFGGLTNNFAVTIPTGAKGHIPAGYVFKDSYDQEEYDHLVADGYEEIFWDTHSNLVEGVDYTLGVESTFVITAENASQIFGKATVSFQAPTEASNSEWVFWRKSELKTFSDMSSGDQKVYKDVTVKVNNGVYNTNSGFGVHFDSSDEDGVQFVAPEGKVFKRIVILNEYGTFSDPNWSYDKNYKRWSGSADTVGFVGDICGISLIEFELGDSKPTPGAVMNLINAIGTVELTAECKAKIDAARAAYDALSDGDKGQVTNIATLTTAETDYAALAAAAAAPVIAQIEALPTTIKLSTYFSTYDLMVTARAAYNALSAEVQAAVTNLSKLTNLEAAFAAIGGANEKLSKPFSVGEGQVVYFSHGNLQATYNGSNWSWAFAAHQYDYIGDASGNIIINGNGTLSGAGTVDLFGWVANSSTVLTSGVAKYGVSNSDNVGDYGLGTTETLKGDWGVAANDANIGGYNDWRILSNDEWVYLFKTRTDAASKYGYATVGDANGVIIIPDAFTDPMKNKGNLAFRPQNVDKGYSTNVYATGGDWEAMEAAGAVFMPAAGRRYGTTMTVNEGTGFYWSSTPMSYQASYFMGFMGSNVVPNNDRYRSHGFSVRLVSNNAPVASTPLDSALVVKDLIDAIPAEITLEAACVNAVQAAREAYNKLSEAAKGLLDEATIAKLTDAETALTALYQAEADKVVAKINNIPTPVTLKLATRDSIESARAAYDALNANQKALVPAADLQKLTDAEAELATLNPAGGAPLPEGALTGAFSINADGSKIAFSKGNLQATTTDLGANWTWAFAAHQYDYVGNAVANTAITGNKTVSTNGTIDLFGWSTAATYYGINNTNVSGKHPGDFIDWGETIAEGWRTLTRDEWGYLFETRTDAASKYGHATVAGIHGIIVLPDSYKGTAINADHSDWSNNIISAEDWAAYEANGVAFLPAAGSRLATNVNYVGEYAFYWTSTTYYEKFAYRVRFVPNLSPDYGDRVPGQSVRLVTAHTGGATPLDSAQVVKDLIEAIPAEITLDAACVNAVQAARDAYNALSEAAQGALDAADVQKLNQAITDYTALIQAGADAVVAKIAAIPQPVTLKLATRDSINNARAAYDALTADQKLLVSNYDVLTAAEATWAGLINVAPAGALSGKYTINDGGDVIYFAHGNLQYTRENLDADWSTGTFRLAENQYDLIEPVKTYPDAYCTDNYGDKTAVGLFGWGTWGEGKTPNLTSSDRSLYTWSTDFSGTLEGTDTWRTLTKDEWVYLLAHNNLSYATVHGVNGLLVAPDGKEIEGKSMTAWVEINDETWTTMQNDGYLFLPACGQRSQISGANITTGGQGEEVLYYSSTEYNDTYAYNIWYKPSQAPAADDHSNKRQAFGIRLVSAGVNPLNQAQAAKDLIDAIPQQVVYTPECGAAIKAAREAVDALGANASLLDDADIDKLTQAETAYAGLLAEKVAPVIAAINAVPATPLTDADKKLSEYNKVTDARALYDALATDEEKAAVTNYDKLTAAEAAFAAISGGTPAGALSGAFTINEEGDRILFSKGNLQATTTDLGANWTWGFAGKQYDVIGSAAANNAINGNGTVSENGTVDLFGWSTADTYFGIYNHNNNDGSAYLGDFVDWGATMGAGWRTLTKDEWNYILNVRTSSDDLRSAATVCGVRGYVLLPDGFILPAGLSWTAQSTTWDANTYDAQAWTAMEVKGAVFLPAGNRIGTTIDNLNNMVFCWSATAYDALNSYNLLASPTYTTMDMISRAYGFAVRLTLTADTVGVSALDAAQAAKDLIDAIPQPVVYTPECGAAIKAAREAVDALGENASLLDEADLQKLTDAEAAYAQLLAQAVAAVKAQIDALPATPLTDADKKLSEYNKVLAAREAYNALFDEEKAAVTNYDKLEAAEAAFAAIGGGGGSAPAGALNGKFTINEEGDQIAFSKGNLQATTTDLGANWTWGFAANQWDYLGIAVANSKINGNGTVSENGTVDLFGWSTAATYYGINNSYKAVDYIGDFVDWGPNMGAGWRTLTKDEWAYLLQHSSNGKATVNDKNGYIFLPDNWSGPAFTPDQDNFTTNVYSGDDWTAMENAGAVFLPYGPARNGTYALIAMDAKYCSSTSLNNDTSYVFTIYYNQSQSACTGTNRAYGCMVRLVSEGGGATPLDSAQAAKDLIDAIPSPVVVSDECKAKIDAARDAVTALGENASLLDDADIAKLATAEADFALLIKDATAVVAKIDAIGEVTFSPECKAKIVDAREAYEALSDELKPYVSNLAVLTAAEAAYEAARPFAPMTTVPAAVEALQYTGAAQALITAGAAEHGTILYSLDGENYSAELPTALLPGAYTIYYKVQATDDYKDVAPVTVTATIAYNYPATYSLFGIPEGWSVKVNDEEVAVVNGAVQNIAANDRFDIMPVKPEDVKLVEVVPYLLDLATVTDSVIYLMNGDSITGTANGHITVVIVPDAKVYFKDVNLTNTGSHPAVLCGGNAEIVIVGENSITCTKEGEYGIRTAGAGTTLTISGDKTLLNATIDPNGGTVE